MLIRGYRAATLSPSNYERKFNRDREFGIGVVEFGIGAVSRNFFGGNRNPDLKSGKLSRRTQMFDKKKIMILPLAALALTMSGTAFANSNNRLAEQAIYGSKNPIVQDMYTNEATAGVTKTTPVMKLSDKAVYGSKSPIVQDKYTNEG
jgi:hypothetical protein